MGGNGLLDIQSGVDVRYSHLAVFVQQIENSNTDRVSNGSEGFCGVFEKTFFEVRFHYLQVSD